jgi:hypothetical protein
MRSQLLIALALLAAACAQSRGDINRVQPNVVKKSDLIGSATTPKLWYFRNTVVWTPANTGFTFEGETGTLEKIVFEITEHALVGYRTYPYILGTDSNIDPTSKVSAVTATYRDANGNLLGGQAYFGAPIVSFPIKSHFDIERGYNPATGEPTNVIMENTTDRPWNERDYIRVDWSVNQLNKNSGMRYGLVDNPAGGSSSSSWVQPNEKVDDPQDLPSFENDGSGDLKYFDFTGRYMAYPTTFYSSRFGYMPACWFGLYSAYDCTASEIRMRMSFARVDGKKSRDYQSLIYNTDLQSKFSYYGVDRLNWDKKYGFTEDAVLHLAGRYRIWEESYAKDASGEPILSQPIPLGQRTPKPIVYYLTAAQRMGGYANYNLYRASAAKLQAGWDRAFRRAAAAAQQKDPDAYPQMLYVCDNPVVDYAGASDPLTGQAYPADVAAARQKACGPIGFSPKFGDLRYSFMNTVAEPVPNGLLGYGPNSVDPESGEIISGNANTYLWGIEYDSQYLLDLIDLITGEKQVTDYIKGDTVRNYILSNPIYSIANLPKGDASDSCGGCLLAADQQVTRTTQPSLGSFQRPAPRMVALNAQLKATGGLPAYSNDPLQAATDTLAQNPTLEAAVLDNPDFSYDIESLLPSPLADQAAQDPAFKRNMQRSILTSAQSLQELEDARMDALTDDQCHIMTEFNDRTLVDLAYVEASRRTTEVTQIEGSEHDHIDNNGDGKIDEPQEPRDATPGATPLPGWCGDRIDNNGDGIVDDQAECLTYDQAVGYANEQIKGRLKQNEWEATSEHEIGHTFNAVHNFQGSYDAVNYFPDYWTIRKGTLFVQQNGENVIPRTPVDLHAAADGTQAQLAQGMHNYEYSSIMDYAGTRVGNWQGIGKYDEAAIIFAYSGDDSPGYVEVFDSARRAPKTFNGSDGNVLTVTGAAFDLPIVNAQRYTVNDRNYTEQFHYSMVPLHFGEGNTIDEVLADGLSKLEKRHLEKWSDVQTQRDVLRAVIAAKNGQPLSDSDVGVTALEVPYMNCSDAHVNKVLSCARFDRGPDYYEITRTKLENYWNYYVVTHFRRDRASFSGAQAINVAYTTFEQVSDFYKQWVLFFYGTQAANQQVLTHYQFDPQFQDYWTMATLDGINQHLNVMTVPPAGYFEYRNFDSSSLTIPGIDGNPIACSVDTDCPYGVCTSSTCRIGPRWDIISEGVNFDSLNDAGKGVLKGYYSDASQWNPAASGYGELPRGPGRRMFSRYDFRSGYGFFQRMLEAGHYNDQFGAMHAAIDYRTQLFQVDYRSDANRYNIPYYLVFKNEMTRTFGSLWSQNEDLVRPIGYLTLDDAGHVQPESLAMAQRRFVAGEDFVQGFKYPYLPVDRVVECTSGVTKNCFRADQLAGPLNINVTWTSRIYSLFLGEAAFRVNYDLDYAKANLIFRLGSGEQITIEPGYHAVEVQDQINGARYIAVEKDGETYPYSTPALRKIRETQDFLAVVNNPQACPLPGTLRIYSCLPASQRNDPVAIGIWQQNWLQNYKYNIRDLDLMRGFYSLFGKAF